MNSTINTEKPDLTSTISKLKSEDNIYARLVKAFQIIYLLFIPIYVVLVVKDYIEEKDLNALIGGGCFILCFLIFIITFGKYYKEFRHVDYSLPTIQMLKKAADRYKPFKLKTLWAFVAVLVMDVGLVLDIFNDIPLLISQSVFFGVMIIAVGIGLLVWRIKYKPLRDNVLLLIKEIEKD